MVSESVGGVNIVKVSQWQPKGNRIFEKISRAMAKVKSLTVASSFAAGPGGVGPAACAGTHVRSMRNMSTNSSNA